MSSTFSAKAASLERLTVRTRCAWSGVLPRFAQRAVDAFLAIVLLPAPHRPADAGAARHLHDRQPVGGKQNDPGALDVSVRAVAVAGDRGQSRAVLGGGNHTDGLGHGCRLARTRPL
jgi:hypothetical protein